MAMPPATPMLHDDRQCSVAGGHVARLRMDCEGRSHAATCKGLVSHPSAEMPMCAAAREDGELRR